MPNRRKSNKLAAEGRAGPIIEIESVIATKERISALVEPLIVGGICFSAAVLMVGRFNDAGWQIPDHSVFQGYRIGN